MKEVGKNLFSAGLWLGAASILLLSGCGLIESEFTYQGDKIVSAAEADDGGTIVLAKEYYEGQCSFGIRLEPEDCAPKRVYTKLVKLDGEGDVEWAWRQELEEKTAHGAAELETGVYLVHGWSVHDYTENVLWLAAFDKEGDRIWEMEEDQPILSFIPVVMEKASPSSMLVFAATHDEDVGYGVFSFTIHADGTVSGRRVTPMPSSTGLPVDFARTTDGGYVVAAEGPGSAGALVKFDEDGRLQWSRTFGGEQAGTFSPLRVREMPGGAVAATFGKFDSFAGIEKVELKIVDGNYLGNPLASGEFNFVDPDIEILGDGSILLTGASGDPTPDPGTTLTLVDADGSIDPVWTKTSVVDREDADAEPTGDGGFVLHAGSARLEKYDADGNLQWVFESAR
jgi:hypothetical protein